MAFSVNIEFHTRTIPEGSYVNVQLGNNIMGKTVGIYGFGAIGIAVAERIRAFKLKRLIYSSR